MTEASTGLSRAEFDRHYDALYSPHLDWFAENAPGSVIGISAPEPSWKKQKQVDGTEIWVPSVRNPTRWAPLDDPDRIFDFIRRGTNKGGSVRFTLAPRLASILENEDNGRWTPGVNTDLAGVVTVRADIDTIDGNHSRTDLPTREQLPAILATCPLGAPTVEQWTAGGEHWDWALKSPVSAPEAARISRRMINWLEQTGEDLGIHFGDAGVTSSPRITSRFAGTIHGKDDERRDRTLHIVSNSGIYYTPEDFDRLPEKRLTAAEIESQAKMEARRAARDTGVITISDQLPAWKKFSHALPPSRIIQDVLGMRIHSTPGADSSIWAWPDSGTVGGSLKATTNEFTNDGDPDGMEKIAVFGSSTADILGVEQGTGGHTSYSLLLSMFCEGDTVRAGTVARRFLTDPDGAIAWMQERWDTGSNTIIDPENTGRTVADRIAAAREGLSEDALSRYRRAASRMNKLCKFEDAARVIFTNEPPAGCETTWDLMVTATNGDESQVELMTADVETGAQVAELLETLGRICRFHARKSGKTLVSH